MAPNFFFKYLSKQLLSGNMVILRALQNLRKKEKLMKPFFSPLSIAVSGILFGLLGEAVGT